MEKKNDYVFQTGSRFSGSYNANMNCMAGFGVYTFPDGSEYRGYFKNGRFNGYGRLKLAPPNKFIFRGLFEDGELIKIEDMYFADGLRFTGEINDNKIDCSQWKYCNKDDRRYSTEVLNDLEPVGPNAYVTRQRPARDIPLNCYDTEEGIFKPTTSFLIDIRPPFYKNRFVACKKEREWILKNCRHGSQYYEEDLVEPPNLKFWRRILETNINTNLEAVGADYRCECQRLLERQKLREQLKEKKEKKNDYDSASAFSYPYSPSFSSCSSMQEKSMSLPAFDICKDDLAKLDLNQQRKSELPQTRKSFIMQKRSISQ